MQIFAHFNISPRSLHSHAGGRKVNIMVVARCGASFGHISYTSRTYIPIS